MYPEPLNWMPRAGCLSSWRKCQLRLLGPPYFLPASLWSLTGLPASDTLMAYPQHTAVQSPFLYQRLQWFFAPRAVEPRGGRSPTITLAMPASCSHKLGSWVWRPQVGGVIHKSHKCCGCCMVTNSDRKKESPFQLRYWLISKTKAVSSKGAE